MVRSRSRPAGTAAVYRASETAMAPAMVSSLLWSGKQLVALDKARVARSGKAKNSDEKGD
mgnify:CR=1 FL=1